MRANIQKLLKFFHLCEQLKIEKRHGKTSDNKHDRVASHSWRLAIMVMFLSPFLKKEFDLVKALKISIIHDLAEILTGDQAYFHHAFDTKAKKQKQQKEEKAMLQLMKYLPIDNQKELKNLWLDYEQQTSYEAKIVKALDKAEAQMQHNEAHISIWNDFDKAHYASYLDSYCNFDQTLTLLKELIQNESKEKLRNS